MNMIKDVCEAICIHVYYPKKLRIFNILNFFG